MVMENGVSEKERLSEEVYPVSDLLDRFVLSLLFLSIIKIQSDYLVGFMGKRERRERVEPEGDSEDGWEWYI